MGKMIQKIIECLITKMQETFQLDVFQYGTADTNNALTKPACSLALIGFQKQRLLKRQSKVTLDFAIQYHPKDKQTEQIEYGKLLEKVVNDFDYLEVDTKTLHMMVFSPELETIDYVNKIFYLTISYYAKTQNEEVVKMNKIEVKIGEGIMQLEKLMDQMDYTQEAAKNMTKNPIIMWNAFTEGIQTRSAIAMSTIVEKILALSESGAFDAIANGFNVALSVLTNGLIWVLDAAVNIYDFFVDNWSWIDPLISGIAIAVVSLGVAFLITKSIISVATFIAAVWAIATGAMTVAQGGLNAAIWACLLLFG